MPSRGRPKSLLVFVALILAGCGSSASKSSGAGAGGRVSGTLSSWLVQGHEEPGYHATSTTADTTAQEFVAEDPESERGADAAQLRGNGFRAAAVEHMQTKDGRSAAISLVIETGSSAAARREATYQLHSDISAQGSGAAITRFSIPGVPGSQAFTATASGHPGSAANAVFVEGSCVLTIGDYAPSASVTAPIESAAVAVFKRTQGRCP